MYERIQGNDMYNAGPNQPFSASVTFNTVALSNPNLSLLTGQTLTAPITVGSITGLAYTDYKLPVSYQSASACSMRSTRDPYFPYPMSATRIAIRTTIATSTCRHRAFCQADQWHHLL